MEIVQKKTSYVKAYCGRNLLFNPKDGKWIRAYCGLFSCGREICQYKAWIKRVRLITDLILEHQLKRFFTLTLTRDVDEHKAWEVWPKIWIRFRHRILRLYPDWQFVLLLEAHKDGYPHGHGFSSLYIPQAVLLHHWRGAAKEYFKSGGVNIKAVTGSQEGEIAQYVTKNLGVARYVGKSAIVTARQYLKKGKRSLYRSKGLKTKSEINPTQNDFHFLDGIFFHESENKVDNLFEIVYSKEIGMYKVKRTYLRSDENG